MNFKTNLHLVNIKFDGPRSALQYIYFRNGFVEVCDTVVLVKQKLKLHGFSDTDIDRLNGHAVHAQTFAEIRKAKEITVTEDGHIQAKKGRVTVKYPLLPIENGQVVDGADTHKIPDFAAVVPDLDNETKQLHTVCFDAKRLSVLEKVTLSEEKVVRFHFTGETRACLASGLGFMLEDELLLIMPHSVADKYHEPYESQYFGRLAKSEKPFTDPDLDDIF